MTEIVVYVKPLIDGPLNIFNYCLEINLQLLGVVRTGQKIKDEQLGRYFAENGVGFAGGGRSDTYLQQNREGQ